MNIFILDLDKTKSAQYQCNSHCSKMPTETAQMLSTVIRERTDRYIPDGYSGASKWLYKKTHAHHPCNDWIKKSRSNFLWLCDFGIELCKEYTYRYGKIIKSQTAIEYAYEFANLFPDGELTPFAQAMPDKYKDADPVAAYRKYYLGDKKHLFVWKKRPIPDWINEKDMVEALDIQEKVREERRVKRQQKKKEKK